MRRPASPSATHPVAAALVAALAGACAQAPTAPPPVPELVVVLPGPDGATGSVVVEVGGARQVLDRPYAARRVGRDGTVATETLDAGRVEAAFTATLAALPGRPATFQLYFLDDSDQLTPASLAELDRVFDELRHRPEPDIVVTGHTDTRGSAAHNDRLSLARAERLRDLLAERGLPRERILAAGRGKRELLVPTADNVPEARNRRVEIRVR